MIFSADNHVLIKLLQQEKGYGAKSFIAEFSSKPRTMPKKINKQTQCI